MKAVIIYAGKYGATEQYAQWLAERLQLPVLKADDANAAALAGYDLVILGSSVYVGQLVIRTWLQAHQVALLSKKLLLFIVCGSTYQDPPEQRKVLENNLEPALRKTTRVFFLPGRCIIKNLSWKDRLLLRFGALAAKDPVQKAAMRSGFDRLDRAALDELASAARAIIIPGNPSSM
ncbi:hypothetical protein DCC81_07460 [Chitinophaga parva]|uniref:Flavodoxin domain-containing protein n=1 Tax=Chitinophaga parva TaxID=2169414 RepID=A0A2T7BNM6_9BACT|nr:flavodoxin domain-containing protein [Chitinophaga parva]PUZ29287.1 hypothetical protein DCC81_07460 [Chitinophaga parva]